jgi:hypothetical protein
VPVDSGCFRINFRLSFEQVFSEYKMFRDFCNRGGALRDDDSLDGLMCAVCLENTRLDYIVQYPVGNMKIFKARTDILPGQKLPARYGRVEIRDNCHFVGADGYFGIPVLLVALANIEYFLLCSIRLFFVAQYSLPL